MLIRLSNLVTSCSRVTHLKLTDAQVVENFRLVKPEGLQELGH